MQCLIHLPKVGDWKKFHTFNEHFVGDPKVPASNFEQYSYQEQHTNLEEILSTNQSIEWRESTN